MLDLKGSGRRAEYEEMTSQLNRPERAHKLLRLAVRGLTTLICLAPFRPVTTS